MFLLAIAGSVFPLNLMFARQQKVLWIELFNLASFGTWAIVGVLAMLMTSVRAATAFRRLGFAGPTRPRWWFEIARSGLNVAAVSFVGIVMFVGIMMGPMLNNPQPQFPAIVDIAFFTLANLLEISLPIFLAAATTGYGVSFVFRKPRIGQAYDCVHFFYVTFVPLGLLVYAALLIPPQPQLPAIVIPGAIGIVGVLGLLLGFISNIRRHEAREQRQQMA